MTQWSNSQREQQDRADGSRRSGVERGLSRAVLRELRAVTRSVQMLGVGYLVALNERAEFPVDVSAS